MTYIEARDILDKRINWRDTSGDLTAANTASDSGRFFQDEHSAISLDNIKACQPDPDIDVSGFNAYLTQLRHASILQVLSDVYGTESSITQSELDCNVGVFDNAISLRMVVVVAEIVITSTRSNRSEEVTKEFIQQLHFDVNGNSGASASPNFPRAEGFSKKYQDAITYVRRYLKKQKRITTITTG